ncbi:hypothetical protein TIFTF001_041989 [Ficus carica]|uniref:Uncharacterized protein n=1 Tax=Ficus carica TaxID=3494 RepID=A0AA87ZKW9_FICCA|nr:hypothetical protein TIFTF001_041989 [Ficus carica]
MLRWPPPPLTRPPPFSDGSTKELTRLSLSLSPHSAHTDARQAGKLLLSWEDSIRNGQNPSPTFSVIVHCGCVLN